MPSKPSDSILTLSPTSKVLDNLLDASDCRLGGRLVGRAEIGVLERSCVLVDEVEAAEEGLPATDRRPDAKEWGGERDEPDELADKGIGRWWEGSFALIASANAREISSLSERIGFVW